MERAERIGKTVEVEKMGWKIGWIEAGAVLSVLYLLFYVFATSKTIQNAKGTNSIVTVYQLIPYLLIFLTTVPIFLPSFITFFNPLANRKFWLGVCILIMVSCTILTYTPILGWWWSWKSFGMLWAVIALVLYLTQDIPDGWSLYLGVGIVIGMADLWEIAYQVGLYSHGNLGGNGYNLAVLIFKMLVQIVPCCLAIWFVRKRYSQKFQVYLPALLCLGIAAICFGVWFGTGMYVVEYWKHNTDIITYYHPEWPLMAAIVHTSKAALVAAPAALLLPWKKEKVKETKW